MRSELADIINRSCVTIPPGEYCVEIEGKSLVYVVNAMRVVATPVTNGMFVEFLNASGEVNEFGGTYSLINTVNINQPLRKRPGEALFTVPDELVDHPVVGVTWEGAMKFARFVGGCLPREIEWQLVATAGDPGREFPWGNRKPSPALANYGEHVGATTPVGMYPPNPWGLFDLAGNVREWCSNWVNEYHHDLTTEEVQPEGPLLKVVRGGGWNLDQCFLSNTRRDYRWPRVGSVSVGFRVFWIDGNVKK